MRGRQRFRSDSWAEKLVNMRLISALTHTKPAHRAQLRRLITEIITAPERVVAGTFRGQGVVKFFIKGEDVVVTTPMEEFVTILKGGVHNPAVQRALQL